MGWTSPLVLTGLIGGVALLIAFCFIELRVDSPMFDLRLLKIRSFSTGATAALLASIARGGMQFMLIIWLQGIWLVLHGYSFIDTPLWSGIYLLPLTVGFLIAGPLSGWLSDRYGARFFASGGLLLSAAVVRRPAAAAGRTSATAAFAALIFLSGAGMGLFSAPNAAAVMNSVPPNQRGAASGMLATFTNSGFVLSIGIFFSLMIAGLASTLPTTLTRGPHRPGRAAADRASDRQPAAGRQPVRRVPRLQPRAPAARADRRAQPPAGAQRGRADRQGSSSRS